MTLPITTPGQSTPGAGDPASSGTGAAQDAATQTDQLPSDAVTQEQLEEALATIQRQENDIRRIKSSTDSRAARQQKAYSQELQTIQARLVESETKDLDDAAKLQYQSDYNSQRYNQLQKQNTELQRELENTKTMNDYIQEYQKLGIDMKELDTSSPEALVNSGWTAILADRSRMQALIDAEQQAPTAPPETPVAPDPIFPGRQPQVPSQPQAPPQAPAVVTQRTGSAPVLDASISSMLTLVREQYGKPELTVEQMFRMADQGKVDVQAMLDNAVPRS